MKVYNYIFLALIFMLYSCGSGSTGPGASTSQGSTSDAGAGSSSSVATVTVTATPSTVSTLGTSSISATVLDSLAANVADGTTVTFTVSNALGTVTSASTTSSGVATATFTAASTAGTTVVTATAGSVSNTVTLTVTAPDAGSVVFTSATPQVLGLKGFGQAETSAVIFNVNDINGIAIADGTSVSFTMSGPGGGRLPDNGGEYIGDSDASPTTASASTTSGAATVFLHSGAIAGPVTIVASVTVGGTTISSSSAVISIGGGVPSATHFSIASSVLNLAGYTSRSSLGFLNEQSTISAFAADRFGNFNVLQGTSISFYAEAGAIDNSATVDASGATTVTFRTQAPMPENVASTVAETTTLTNANTTYGTPTTFNPRDGHVTIFATVMGEEAFLDANANGIYDSGETFTDAGEPFYDNNNDGVRDDGTGADPFELFIDANGNSSYDGPNGCWDGPNPSAGYSCAGRQNSKMIFTSQQVQFTGHPMNIVIVCDAADGECDNPDPSTSFTIADGGSLNFNIIIGDVNLNTPVGGSAITVTKAGAGTLTSFVPTPIADQVSSGPITFSVNLADATAGDALAAAAATVAVEVTWKGVKYSATASGTVD